MRFSEFAGRPNNNTAHAGPLAVSSTAITLASLVTLDAQTCFVVIKVETAAIRLTVQGTTPTSTLGFNFLADTQIVLSKAEAEKCKIIRATGTDAALQVAQYVG